MLTMEFKTNIIPDDLHKLINEVDETGKQLDTYHVHKLKQQVIHKIGWYKKPGFDAAFAAYKNMVPTITEAKFAYVDAYDPDTNEYHDQYLGPNTCFVDKLPYTGDDNCVVCTNEIDYVETGVHHITISILSQNIDDNSTTLKSILVGE